MEHFANKTKKDHTGQTKKPLILSIMFLLCILFLAHTIFQDSGFFKIIEIERTETGLYDKIEKVNSTNQDYEEEINRLKADSSYIALLAKEQLALEGPTPKDTSPKAPPEQTKKESKPTPKLTAARSAKQTPAPISSLENKPALAGKTKLHTTGQKNALLDTQSSSVSLDAMDVHIESIINKATGD